jgi:hypothetical protein
MSDIILGVHADITPVVSIESIATAVGVVDEWDELIDTLNLSHDVVAASVFTIGAPPGGRSNNGMTGTDGSVHDQCGKERFQDFGSEDQVSTFGHLSFSFRSCKFREIV